MSSSSSKKFYKSSMTKLKFSERLKSSIILPELPAAKYLQISDKETIKTRVFSDFASMKIKADKDSHSLSQRKFKTQDIKDQPHGDQSQLLLSTLGILNSSSAHQLPKDIKKLKKILTSAKTMDKLSLGVPATREDTTKLADWLNSMLKSALNENNQNIESLCETAMVIYEVCLYEIVRQVSVHCIERGELINLVWKAYMGILEKALKISKAVQELQKTEFSQELEKITQDYDQQIEKLNKDNAQLNEDLNCLRRMVKTREEECSNMARKEVKIIEKVHILQKQYESTKRELLYLQEDNRIMKAKLFNSSVEFVENSQGVIEPRLVSIQKIKRKSEGEILKIANSDPLLSAQMVSDEKTESLMKSIEKYDEYTKVLMSQVDFLDKNEATENFAVEAEVQTDNELFKRYSDDASSLQLMELKIENVMDIFEDNKEETFENQDIKEEEAEHYFSKFQEKINQVNQFLDKVKANIQKNSPSGIRKDLLKTFYNSVQDSIATMEQEQEQDKDLLTQPFERKQRPKLLTFIQKIEKTAKKETKDLISLITQKVLQTPAHKLKSIVFKRMLMKLISSFYEVKLKKMLEGDRKQNMTQIVTEMFYNKYGMPKVVENKYVQLLSSCIKYKSIKRVHNFGRFLRLYDNYTLDDLNFFMDSIAAMKQTHYSENGEELKIHVDKALEWCKNFLPGFLPSADLLKMKNFVENFKQVDPVTRVPTIEVDALLEYCIEVIHKNRVENADFLMSIYEAGDVFDI